MVDIHLMMFLRHQCPTLMSWRGDRGRDDQPARAVSREPTAGLVGPRLGWAGHYRLSVLGGVGHRARPPVADPEPRLVEEGPRPQPGRHTAGGAGGMGDRLGRVVVAAASAEPG